MDLLQMMQCPQCGYVMGSFDKVCPRCQGRGIAPPPTAPASQPPPVQRQRVQASPIPHGLPTGYDGIPTVPSGGAGLGIASMLIGLASVLLFFIPGFPILASIVAIALGALGLKSVQSRIMSIIGIVLGCFSLVIVVLIAGFFMTIFGITATGSQAIRNLEAQRIAQIKVDNTSAIIDPSKSSGSLNTIKITGTATNTSRDNNSGSIVGTAYSPSNVTLGEGKQWLSLRPGETKAFEIYVYDNTRTSGFTYKVRVE